MKKSLQLSLAVFILSLALIKAQGQGSGIFLKVDGITGLSRTTLATGLIDVSSYGTSAACNACTVTPGGTGGAGTGKVAGGKIVFNLLVGPEVAAFKTLMFAGRPAKTACFVFTKATGTGKPLAYYYVVLANATVIETDEAAGDDAHVNVQVSLGYSAIAYVVKAQKPDGTLDKAVTTGWNFVTNSATALPAVPAGL